MKAIFRTLAALLAMASLILPISLFAADQLSEGTVKKIDAASQRVMLTHGPIENLGMPPMTMMFKVKDATMLKQVKNGDKVHFRVEDLGGEYTVVRIETAQ